jgi:hypothetical protein
MEHADVFLSHGRTHLAIQLLRNHLEENPKESATTWLFLLDLLAKEDFKEEYELAANECRKHFNVQLGDFSNTSNDKNSFESFEHLNHELQKLWGTTAALSFLDDLIYNHRLEPRMGFNKEVFEELLVLRSIALEAVKSAEVIDLHEEKTARKVRLDNSKLDNAKLSEKELTMPSTNAGALEFNSELSLLDEAPAQEAASDVFEFELPEIMHG